MNASASSADRPWPRAAWYPTVGLAALRAATDGKRAILFSLLGEALALWCTGDGTPVALADRCAHQEAELSTGLCRGDVLICRHHGWTHDPDGTARPPGGRNWKPPPGGWPTTPSYRVAQHLGYLWVALEATGDPLPGAERAPGGEVQVVTRKLRLPADELFERGRDGIAAGLRAAVAAAPARSEAPFSLTFGSGDPSTSPFLVVVAVTPLEPNASQICGFIQASESAALTSVLDRAIAGIAG
jgi:nitrite reductase/ring-hydroxylating ferredoxin subunit